MGDQLCKLGEVSLVGSRHYAVAAKLRDVAVTILFYFYHMFLVVVATREAFQLF